MAARRPVKLSLHRAPLSYRHCRQLLEIIGVPRDYQDQFIIHLSGGGYTVRVKAAGDWVAYYLKQWRMHIDRLRRQFEANGDWPPPSIAAGFKRMVLAGLTNEEAHAVLDPVLGIDRTHLHQARYYRFLLAKEGKLPPELCPQKTERAKKNESR